MGPTSSLNLGEANITPKGRLERTKHYAYRAGKFEAVIVPLKVQHKSTLPPTSPKAVVIKKRQYKAVLEGRGFYPFF